MSDFAVIEAGGKQYTASVNKILSIEKIAGQKGEPVVFEKVLLAVDGDNVKLGKPYVKDAKVLGVIVQQGKGRKIDIFKYKAKSKYRRTYGHRQPFTAVRIEKIES